MAKHLIDSDVYIDFLRSGKFHAEISRIYAEYTPSLYFSSVVIEELLAGAASSIERKNVEVLYQPFEQTGRIVTPTHTNWKATGDLLAQIFRKQPSSRSQLPHLVADCLIAMSARAIGATVYTRNRKDFELIQRSRHFRLVVLE
jgi:predicted nucleic acid-binding protein